MSKRLGRKSNIVWLVNGILCLLPINQAAADVVSDQSLRTPTQVEIGQNRTFNISGGTRSGSFIFHSFQDFSLTSQETASFEISGQPRGLIARVTGGRASRINGLIQAQSNADIFFLNPSGISFGRNAQLDLGGSFIASTAETLNFSNNRQYRVNTASDAPFLLQISTPTGLQVGVQSAPIEVQGEGHGLIIDPISSNVIPVNRPLELLQVRPMQTLGLVGGDILLDGGNLQASGGRIFLTALGDNESVDLDADRFGWKPRLSDNQSSQNIQLDNASSIITNGNGGGQIDLRGRFVDILGGSTLLATSFGTQAGRGVRISATEESLISGVLFDQNTGMPTFPSSILSEVGFDQESQGGPINIRSPFIEISEGAQLSTSTFGFGDGGDISLIADEIVVTGGTDTFGPSGIYLDVIDELTEGNGGNLRIRTQDLLISRGGLISASTFGPGNSGVMNIQAERVEVVGGAPFLGASAILSQGENFGSIGGINITSDRLNVLDGAQISSTTFGFGGGGNIRIDSNLITLDGSSPANNAGGILSLVAVPEFLAPGEINQMTNVRLQQGGGIDIIAENISIDNGAEINSATDFIGNSGDINIQSNVLSLDASNQLATGIFSTSRPNARGAGGNVNLAVDQLSVKNGAQIAVSTRSSFPSGSLTIQANQVRLDSLNSNARSGLFANALTGTGEGGDIFLETNLLRLVDGATINVGNFSSLGASSSPGQGAAGSVDILAQQIFLDNQASITASTAVGDRGDLTLDSDLLFLNQQSKIQTNTTSSIGGNININTLKLFGLNNSDITANASQGRGGQVIITAEQIFGSQPRSTLSPLSDITASSDLGLDFSGTIEVNLVNPASNLSEVINQEEVIDPSQLLARSCFQTSPGQQSKFLVKGAGGVTSQPYSSTTTFFDTLNVDEAQRDSPSQAPPAKAVQEATQFLTLPNNSLALGTTC